MRNEHLGCHVRSAYFVLALVCGLAGWPVAAQSDDADGPDPLNYAFASQLGSGIYQVSGRTVQIYRVPFYLPIRHLEDRSPGIKLTLPVCVGFFDLNPGDVEQTEQQDDFATASIVPGVALQFAVRPNWTLEPFVEAGIAMDFHEHQRSWVYTGGLKSLVIPSVADLDLRVGNRLMYVGAHTPGSEYDDDYAMFESGIELRRPLPFGIKGHAVNWGMFAMNYLFLEPAEVLLKEQPLEIGVQYELGVTFGTRDPVDIWRFKVPRIGMGYRFGDGVSAFRLVLGAAF